MAEERTLGIARARDNDEEPSKEELQRRMEEARDSITTTVEEIKENVAQQYESVKDALDWREHFKRNPVAWSAGAAGVGFFVGYGIASALSGDDDDREPKYAGSSSLANNDYAMSESLAYNPSKSNGKDDGPGVIARLKETSAYERLSKEAGSLGDRLVEELSVTAQTVVLPALLKKIKGWIGVDLSNRSQGSISDGGASMASHRETKQSAFEPSLSSKDI